MKKKENGTVAESASTRPRAAWATGGTRRNKSFESTHGAIIDAAIQLIAEKGVEALSVAEVARSMGVDRKTVYYHFADRAALLKAALQWSSEQLTRGFKTDRPRSERVAHISRFVLENPELIKLWTDDFLAPGDIRSRYPEWDAFVDGMRKVLVHHGDGINVELYSTIMLTSAFIAPRVYHNSVRPDLSIDEVVEQFIQEQTRVLAADTRLSVEGVKD
ncbi:MAG: helix-turn-helix domain-containing protein [Sphingobium sp.]